jgi:multisubunit Na+/H+ antiporter MnhC subunit
MEVIPSKPEARRCVMTHIDPNRLGVVAAVMLTAWHGVWLVLVATGQAQRVADFVLRMDQMKSEVVVEAFDPLMAALLLVATAILGYVGGAAAAALWNCLGFVCERHPAAGPVSLSARA